MSTTYRLVKLQGAHPRVIRTSDYGAGYVAGVAAASGSSLTAEPVYLGGGDGVYVIPPEIHGCGAGPEISAQAYYPGAWSGGAASNQAWGTGSACVDAATGVFTATMSGGQDEYSLALAEADLDEVMTEALSTEGSAMSGNVGFSTGTGAITDTTPTITGIYYSSDYSELAVAIGSTYWTSGDAALTVGGGTWSLTVPGGQALADGTYGLTVSQLGSSGERYATISSITLTAPAATLRAVYNSGTELHDATGHISRDVNDQYTGVTIQSHVSAGDPVGLPVWYDSENGTTYDGIRGTPYQSQNAGIRAASLGTDDFVEYVFPEDLNGEAFTLLLGPCRLNSGNDVIARTEVGGVTLRKNAGSNDVVATMRDNTDANVATTGTFFGGASAEDHYWVYSYDPSVPRLYVCGCEADGPNNRTGSTTTFSGTPWLATTHIVFGGASRSPVQANGVSGGADEMEFRIYKGLHVNTPTEARELWDTGEAGYDRTGGGTLWRDFQGVRHGAEMTSSPSSAYPIRSGRGAFPTAEEEV